MAGSEKEEQGVMLDITERSLEKRFDDIGAGYDLLHKKDGWVSFIFYKEQWGCGEWIDNVSTLDDVCRVQICLRKPHESFAETYINGADGDTYFFDSSHGFKYNKVTVRAPSAKGPPEGTIYATTILTDTAQRKLMDAKAIQEK